MAREERLVRARDLMMQVFALTEEEGVDLGV